MGRSARILRIVVVTPIVVYVALLVGLFALQRSILYPVVPSEPFLDLSGAARVSLEVEGGTVPMDLAGPEGAPQVVFFHGNAEQIGFTRQDASLAADAGLRFAAPEYPGYGDAHAGTPSETAILAAARVALAHLDPAPVCVGHSLGSGVAVAMAAEGRCARLVAISAYTSIAALGAEQFPAFPIRFLVLDRFDSLARAPAIAVPTLVIHGRDDDLIPFRMGQALAAAIPGATFLPREHRGHNDIRDRETWAAIGRFVRGE